MNPNQGVRNSALMPRALGSRLVVHGNKRKVVKAHEDCDIIDGFFIIASARPIIIYSKGRKTKHAQFACCDPVQYPKVRLKLKYPNVRLKSKRPKSPQTPPSQKGYIIHHPKNKSERSCPNPLSIGEIDLICWERLSPEKPDALPTTAQ